MGTLLEFLQHSKEATANLEPHQRIHLVLGNESCDLDSTVSTLALAYLKHARSSGNLVVPIMNVCAKYFPLRTETCYVLKKCGIDPNFLIFKDQVDYTLILTKTVETSLVDHHVLSQHDKILEKTVVEIFDHRPVNSEEICKSPGLKKTIKTVGSCTTLITNQIIASNLSILSKDLCYLLYATIIYDTIGLNKDCGKTFDEDVTAAQHLENVLKPVQSRKELFEELWKIHNDTSNLGTKELLYRDLKVVQGVPIPGLPLLVEDYLKRGDAEIAVKSFAEEYQSKNMVLIGIDAGGTVKRDIAIYSTDPQFKNTLIPVLKNSNLDLSEIRSPFEGISCFKQGNIKLTRKFILPLVNEVAVKISSNL